MALNLLRRRGMNASLLRRSFRRVILAAIVGPAAVLPMVACSAGGPDAPGEGTAGGGADGEDDPSGSSTATGTNGSGSSMLGECRAAERADAAASCGEAYTIVLVGDPATCGFDENGEGSYEFCRDVCNGYVSTCTRFGRSAVECFAPCPIDGRRYAQLDDSSAPEARDVGSFLARMAFFEAASVDSFELLRRELTHHGAPRALVAACLAARSDEIVHARMASRLARRHGGQVVAPPALALAEPRSLEAIAIENAVEGCVLETFGVLVGMWQAEHAPTKELRAFFTKLAHDESRHAALAMRIDAWVRSRLDASARMRVDAARRRALEELEASLASEPGRGLGLPSPAEAARIFAAWTAASALAA